MEEVEKLKRIAFKTESGSKWFDDPAKLNQWINEQKNLYAFFNDTGVTSKYGSQQIRQIFNNSWHLLQQIVQNELQRHLKNPVAYNNAVAKWITEFQNLLNTEQLYTSDSPHSEFIYRQGKKQPEYGVAAVSILLNKNLSNIDSVAIEGIEQAKRYLDGNEERKSDEFNKLQEIKDRWNEELKTCRDEWVSEYNTELNTASKLNTEALELISNWRVQTEEQTQNLSDKKDHFSELFENTSHDAKIELERITKTYDDKLALHASVRYWGIQQKQHQTKTIVYGIALGISLLIVVIGLISYSNSVLDQSIKDIHISRLLSAGILTTFGIWLIKILANILMSHMHLATDAQERRTMIHTYLALTRKGQGPKDEDRQLILQTLFRPSASGMVKEDSGPTNLVDMINRLSTKQSN